MAKYIDTEKLIAEIWRRREKCADIATDERTEGVADYYHGKVVAYTEIDYLITSLQQEQQKSKKDCNGCPHCVDRKDQYSWHFKGCFGGPYNGKFIAEIDECPLKQEQQDMDLEIEERKWVQDAVDNIFPEDGDFMSEVDFRKILFMSEVDFRKILKDTARHFYELGLNARKEEKK